MKEKKLLMLSTHLAGGCFQYSNEIIANWPGNKELVMPDITNEHHSLRPDWTIKYYGHNTLLRSLSLICCISRILINALLGRYSGLLIFGNARWDYIVLKYWQLTKLPSYCVVHDGKMHTGEKNRENQKLIVNIMKMATGIIFLSQYVKEIVKDNFEINKLSFIVPHGLIDYGPLPAISKPSKPTLLFLGRVVKYKGIEMLLDAIKKVPSHLYEHLVIAGKWSYTNETEYDHNKVTIVNKWLSNEDITRYIALADIMVFPYLEATQSGVATLAINYLRPVIVTNVGAFKEQFDSDAALFVNPDTNELAEAITTLLEQPERLEQMTKALAKLKVAYSWSSISTDLYNNITRNSNIQA